MSVCLSVSSDETQSATLALKGLVIPYMVYCREPSAEGLCKYDGVRTVQWKWLIAGGEPPTWQAIIIMLNMYWGL